jgi:hypothetical protein
MRIPKKLIEVKRCSRQPYELMQRLELLPEPESKPEEKNPKLL